MFANLISRRRRGPPIKYSSEILQYCFDSMRHDSTDIVAGKQYFLWSGDFAVGEIYLDTHLSAQEKEIQLQTVLRHAKRNCVAMRERGWRRLEHLGPVSVIICTRHRPEELTKCLAALLSQSYKPDELIVVDNASVTDATRKVALAHGAAYVREDRRGLNFARNAGAKVSAGEIVVFTEGDVVHHPQWLARILAAFDEPEIESATGLVLPGGLEIEAQWTFEKYYDFSRVYSRIDFTPELYERQKATCFFSLNCGTGVSMAVRRSAFDRVGYFDDRLAVGADGRSGEFEIWNRIIHSGGTCRYEPSAVAFHFHRQHEVSLRGQIKSYMRGHATSLLIQFEGTREWGNLNRLLSDLPKNQLRRLIRNLRYGPAVGDLMISEEIAGSIQGIFYYLRNRRPRQELTYRPPKHLKFEPWFMSVNKPLVSVVIPAYNASRTLDRTLLSVRKQTYTALEIVVVDDGSSDSTADIVRTHSAVDGRVHLVQQPNAGLAAARNMGINSTSGPFIAPIDADDIWHPEKIERQLWAFLSSGSTCGLVYSDSVMIDEKDRVLDRTIDRRRPPVGLVVQELLGSNFIGNGSSPLMRREAVLQAGMYDSSLRGMGAEGCEDLKLYLGIAERYDFANVPMALTGYRMSSTSMSTNVTQMLRSHWLTVSPYQTKYPEYILSIQNGHFQLTMWYIARAFQLGHFLQGWPALKSLYRQYPTRTLFKLCHNLSRLRPGWWRRWQVRRVVQKARSPSFSVSTSGDVFLGVSD